MNWILSASIRRAVASRTGSPRAALGSSRTVDHGARADTRRLVPGQAPVLLAVTAVHERGRGTSARHSGSAASRRIRRAGDYDPISRPRRRTRDVECWTWGAGVWRSPPRFVAAAAGSHLGCRISTATPSPADPTGAGYVWDRTQRTAIVIVR